MMLEFFLVCSVRIGQENLDNVHGREAQDLNDYILFAPDKADLPAVVVAKSSCRYKHDPAEVMRNRMAQPRPKYVKEIHGNRSVCRVDWQSHLWCYYDSKEECQLAVAQKWNKDDLCVYRRRYTEYNNYK